MSEVSVFVKAPVCKHHHKLVNNPSDSEDQCVVVDKIVGII